VTVVAIDVNDLRSLIREAVADALGQPSAVGKALMSCSEADRIFRKQKGTAAAAYRAGLVKGEQRQGRGRWGFSIYIRTQDAQRLWGGNMASDLARESA
jgi:hypothetical protein